MAKRAKLQHQSKSPRMGAKPIRRGGTASGRGHESMTKTGKPGMYGEVSNRMGRSK